MDHKKLYRSPSNKMVAGVCGGLAEYFAIDATIIRLALVIIVVFSGFFPGVVAYIIGALVMPLPPGATVVEATSEKKE